MYDRDVKRGQHFLADKDVVMRLIQYGDISVKDVVLEIGAGTGVITNELERSAGKVYAIERDERCCEMLRATCNHAEIIQGDVLQIDLPPFDKVISNPPFSLSSKITFKLLEHDFEVAILIYQHEFAKKLIANPRTKDYGRLSVITQYFCTPEILEVLPKHVFRPMSKVVTAIVRLRRYCYKIDYSFISTVNSLFTQRRKKIKNVIPGAPYGDRRPEELGPKQFAKIASYLEK